MNRAPSFQVIGVDFAGPVFVRGSSRVEAYITLFTSVVVREVHSELCRDMTVSAFLMFLGYMFHAGVYQV